MQENMMVVAIKAIDDEIIELELEPVLIKKHKINIPALAMTGDMQQITRELQRRNLRDKIYLPREYCTKNEITLFSYIKVDLIPEKLFDKKGNK